MIQLFGVVLWILGDIFLIRLLNEEKKQRLTALEEMLLLLRELDCDVNEWKLPLEEAFYRQKDCGIYRNKLWKSYCRHKKESVRKGLILAVNCLPADETVKKLLTEYFSQLGKLKKEPAQELYQRVRRLLEAHLEEQKAVFSSRQKVTAGFVGGISTVAAILLL